MAFFRKIRKMLFLNHESLSDEAFLLLWDEFESKNPDFPYERYPKFNLEDMDESECLTEFRFAKQDIPFLADVLQLPNVFTCYQRTVSTRIEGLCILLKRLAYPCRYMISRFGRPVPVLSMVRNHVLDYIFDLHSHRILN